MDRERKIVLVSMPGAGKSPVGVLPAKAMRRSFVAERGLCEEWPSGYLGFPWSNEVQSFVTAD